MEAQRFDTFTRVIARPAARRHLLRGLALSPFAGLVALLTVDAEARKKRKRKKRSKKAKPNAYGCLNVGAACKNAEQCCSGICDGKKGKKACRAHDTFICEMASDICTTGQTRLCGTTNPYCACVLTTGNAPFCGDYTGFPGPALCRDCSQDADCQEEFGAGAACVVYSRLCTEQCPDTGTACVPACNDA